MVAAESLRMPAMTDHRTLEGEFDFHGDALDDVFSTYSRLRARCPV